MKARILIFITIAFAIGLGAGLFIKWHHFIGHLPGDSCQILVLSAEEVQVGVGGESVPAAKVGEQLEKMQIPNNYPILLVYDLRMEDRDIKAVLHNIVEAGYYTVFAIRK